MDGSTSQRCASHIHFLVCSWHLFVCIEMSRKFQKCAEKSMSQIILQDFRDIYAIPTMFHHEKIQKCHEKSQIYFRALCKSNGRFEGWLRMILIDPTQGSTTGNLTSPTQGWLHTTSLHSMWVVLQREMMFDKCPTCM